MDFKVLTLNVESYFFLPYISLKKASDLAFGLIAQE